MSEFSRLTTMLVTPVLRHQGFIKHGAFDHSPTHDTACYHKGSLELSLTLAFHPYDYPEMGIRMQVRDADRILFDRLHPPTEGGIEAMLQAVLKDIEASAVW
ncbi:hypothetical protein TA3x_004966 [Tundrisphaera sp. TA3]|uniref:hypothetical protein n=1 Tax=Tundrisphaera sp. TA3 TaxID=3435775 RepID=UPI003EB6C576